MTGRKQGKLLERFVAGTTARAAALLVGVQANTAIYFYQRVRQLIASKLPNYYREQKCLTVLVAA
jgi:transposase